MKEGKHIPDQRETAEFHPAGTVPAFHPVHFMNDLLDSRSSMNAHSPVPSLQRRQARLAWRLIAIPLIIFCALLGGYAFWLNTQVISNLPSPHALGVFWLCFGWNEAPPLFLLALVGLISVRPPRKLQYTLKRMARRLRSWMESPRVPLVTTLAVFLLTAVGTFAVCMNHPLSMDEFTMDYQAKIFAAGKLAQPVPKAWLPEAELVKPCFADFNDDINSWTSNYLPVYSTIRALFTKIGLPFLMNPVLAALSIPLFFGVLRQVWPADRWLQNAGTLLLAVDAQFALNGMTVFPLTAHLFFNILWLYCYTKPESRLWLWCPWIGFAALGLHQPFVHAVFVLPFLVHWLFTRKFATTVYCAIVYLAACFAWHQWWDTFASENVQGSTPIFGWDGWTSLRLQSMNTALMLSWTSALVPALAFYAVFRRKLNSSLLVAAAASVAVTCLLFWAYLENQGHGWGFRYFFGSLGSLLLVACAGLRVLKSDFGGARARVVLASALVASVLLLGIRCLQVRSVTEPYVAAYHYIASDPGPVVIVDSSSVWYGTDFVRNLPDLSNRPIVVLAPMSAAQIKDLTARYPRFHVRVVKGHDLLPLGY